MLAAALLVVLPAMQRVHAKLLPSALDLASSEPPLHHIIVPLIAKTKEPQVSPSHRYQPDGPSPQAIQTHHVAGQTPLNASAARTERLEERNRPVHAVRAGAHGCETRARTRAAQGQRCVSA